MTDAKFEPNRFVTHHELAGLTQLSRELNVGRSTVWRLLKHAKEGRPTQHSKTGRPAKYMVVGVPGKPVEELDEVDKTDYVAAIEPCARALKGVLGYASIQQAWYVREEGALAYTLTEKPFPKALVRVRAFCKTQGFLCDFAKLLGQLPEYLPGDTIDADRQKLAFHNDTVAVVDDAGVVATRPLAVTDLVSARAPVSYDPAIDLTEIDELCSKLFGPRKDETLLLLAKALWGRLPRTVLVFLGKKGTGKTVFVTTLKHALGSRLSAELSSGVLCRRNPLKPEDNALFMLPLEHARFIIVAENPKKTPLGAEITKQFSSTGDAVPFKARSKQHSMPVKGTIVLTCNDMPAHDTTDTALVERLRVVNFCYSFTGPRMPDEQVEATAQRLAAPLLHLLLRQRVPLPEAEGQENNFSGQTGSAVKCAGQRKPATRAPKILGSDWISRGALGQSKLRRPED